ncbi:MAG: hypothetical protein KatS3mg102_2084 [Planctomycetota bacterium]|nr:MAG: hypothetical protein KatS3mg102_2084 [Planctomycetota bacterium]
MAAAETALATRYKREQNHQILQDISNTLAHLLRTYVPARLPKKKLEVVFALPDEAALGKVKKDTVLVSAVLIDVIRSRAVQSVNQPIVREEEEDGAVVEYRLGAPTFIEPRYLVTPWEADPLENQIVLGAIMQYFFSYPVIAPEDVQGNAVVAGDRPVVELDGELGLQQVLELFRAYERPYRPSLVYRLRVKMESIHRVAVRRVTEKVNIYRKVEA